MVKSGELEKVYFYEFSATLQQELCTKLDEISQGILNNTEIEFDNHGRIMKITPKYTEIPEYTYYIPLGGGKGHFKPFSDIINTIDYSLPPELSKLFYGSRITAVTIFIPKCLKRKISEHNFINFPFSTVEFEDNIYTYKKSEPHVVGFDNSFKPTPGIIDLNMSDDEASALINCLNNLQVPTKK
jgi:hypothetical protein